MTNIAELLKGCPKDTEFYTPLGGKCRFSGIDSANTIRVLVGEIPLRFDQYGRYISTHDAECLLFPSKDCRTWEGWKLPVEPCFKEGEKIEATIHGIKRRVTIREVDKTNRCYFGTLEECIGFSEQDQWHLAHTHYDISNFHVGMPVLVRECDTCVWQWVQYSHFNGVGLFFAVGKTWCQCIPFNDETKHLLGTIDMPSEEYINW